jgi:hypothetical protein
MNSNEQNQNYGFYRQVIDNNFSGDLGTEVLELHLELRRLLVYTGLIRPDKLRGEDEVARIEIGSNFFPVPGLWLGEGLGEDPGTPLYLDPDSKTLSSSFIPVGDTAIFVGIVDKDNHVVCTGIRRIPIK